MTSIQDRLQQLLDGELDAADLAEDPTLASLADRLYGIKIQPVAPKKLRDFDEPTLPSAPLPSTNMMIEVIGDVALEHPPAPSPDISLGTAPIPMPAIPSKGKSFGTLSYLSILGLVFVVANLFGVFSKFVGSACTKACSDEGNTKMNLLEIFNLNSIDGWSQPITELVIGIPDIVACVSLLAAIFLLRKSS
jgi:hypothetical protein